MKQFLAFAVLACMAVTTLGDNRGGGGNTGGGGNNVKKELGGGNKQRDCLASANSYRRKHKDTVDFVWDAQLAREAQAWAERLLRNGGRLQHDSSAKAGENLAVNWADTASDADTVCKNADKRWYAEIKDYNWGTGRSNGGAVGHFTQMVWAGSKKVGYGVAVGRAPQQWNPNKVTSIRVVVGRYLPPGNFNRRELQEVHGLCRGSCPRPQPKPQPQPQPQPKSKTCDDNPTYAADCGGWAKDGECKENPAWMKKNCCRSCSSKTCDDNPTYAADCGGWANRGECKVNAVWMKKYCCKSCSTAA